MNEPQRFRKMPVEVEATQWTGGNPEVLRAFTGMHRAESGGDHFVFTTQSGHGELFVAANGAWLDIEIGEWVVRDARGFYPCKPDIFGDSYEPASSRATASAAVKVVVIPEDEPFNGPVSGRVAVTAPPEHVERAREAIGKALAP